MGDVEQNLWGDGTGAGPVLGSDTSTSVILAALKDYVFLRFLLRQ